MENDIHAYTLDSLPGYMLYIGVPNGRVRPALWISNGRDEPVILAQFHGAAHARMAIDFLDRMADQINEAIHILQQRRTDEPNQGKGEAG